MIVLYYDELRSKDELYKMAKALKEQMGEQVLVLPKQYDLILDCSLDQLVSIKAIIDTAIAEKIQQEDSSTRITGNPKYLN